MDFVESYLKKNNFFPEIVTRPENNLGICVVIPSYNEPDLLLTLDSLWNCLPSSCAVEVIVIVNAPEGSTPLIQDKVFHQYNETLDWGKLHNRKGFVVHVLYRPQMPLKDAGVGLARKIGMDAAIHRFCLAGRNGIIAGFDGDAICLPNYLTAIENHFELYPKSPGASIYFEHPLHTENKELNEGIILYELHLRYLVQSLRFAKFPYAFHTVGSSFAVRSDVYVKQGGMNKKKAGEDFYFLQKVIALGNFSEINSTCIIPASRVSERVPFGTGASMKSFVSGENLLTYRFESFFGIKALVDNLYRLFEGIKTDDFIKLLPNEMQCFLLANDLENKVNEIKDNSATWQTFQNRFFRWFDAFKVVKYLNYLHLNYFTKSLIREEAVKLLTKRNIAFEGSDELLLKIFRDMDRSAEL